MKYAAIKENDFLNGEGVCVSFWVQGCPHKCEGCHNPQQWDFKGGLDLPNDYKEQIIKAISANGITRNFSVLGGEPLCPENIELTYDIINSVRKQYPYIKIFIWTGYVLEKIKHPLLKDILNITDVIIDGPYLKDKRDITLKLRGSTNQRILRKKVDF